MPQYSRAIGRGARLGLSNAILLFFAVWFGSNLDSWLFEIGGPPPVAYYVLFVLFATAVLAATAARRLPLMSNAGLDRTRDFWFWMLAYTIWLLAAYLYSTQTNVATQALITNLEFAIILGLFALLLCGSDLRREMAFAFAVVAVSGALINFYDAWTWSLTSVPGRAAGLHINPNESGLVLTLAMTLALPGVPRSLKWPFVALVGLAVFLTFSRSSWLIFSLSLFLLVRGGYLGGYRLRSVLGIAVFTALVLLAYGILSGTLYQLIAATPLADYLTNNTMQRLGLISFASDHAAAERQNVARFAMQHYAEADAPLLGSGLGATREWQSRISTHNMYLYFLVEGGLIGLLLYVLLLIVLLRKASDLGRNVVLQVALLGLFSHNVLVFPSIAVVLAVVAAGAEMTRPEPVRHGTEPAGSLGGPFRPGRGTT